MVGVSECHDDLAVDCRLRAATDLLAHTWDPVILATLRAGPRRRHALRSAIGGISDKALTQALHRLHTNGLIARHTHPSAPPRVDYTLTDLGRTFVEGPLSALGTWITEYGDALLDAQERGA